jgi:hypothetical protein
MTPHRPLPDLFKEPERRYPFWLRIIFLAAAVLFFAGGILGWLIPVVTGLPFYAVGLVFLGLASERVRRRVNRLERRLSEGTRRKIRGFLARLPGAWVRRLIHIPDEVT